MTDKKRGRPRTEFAVIEWEFLRFDARYRGLPPDEAQAYLHWWAACVHLRRDCFEKSEIEGGLLPDLCGVTPELFLLMVGSCLSRKLASRGPRGSITLDGVQDKHAGLAGWNESSKRLALPEQTVTVTETVTGTGQLHGPEPPEAAPVPVGIVPYQDIQEAWNNVAAAAGCVKCRDLTEARRRKLRTRWNAGAWRDAWLEAINLLPQRPFACGENDRSWRMDFDFFLKPDTVTAIVEGKYAGGAASGKKPDARVVCSSCGKALIPGEACNCKRCGAPLLCYRCLNDHDCKPGETKGDGA